MRDRRRAATDAELLRRTRSDADAFAEIYRRHELSVVTFFLRATGDPELAADLTSETFTVALVHADRFRDDGGPATGWLLGIARNLLLRRWERGRAETRALARLKHHHVPLSDATIERLEAIIDEERGDALVLSALTELPAEQREAIRAHVLDERPYGEVEAELGLPAATLRKRVSRGLAQLRAALGGTR